MDYEERKKLNNDFLNGVFSGRMISDVVRFLKEKDSNNRSGEEVKSLWENYLSEREGSDLKISLYTNIPFCIEKCSFCLYNSKKLGADDNISGYVDNIIRQYGYFADIFKGRKLSSFYFGGGTPNILGSSEIERVLSALRENYEFKESGERTFEGNPILATEAKMKMLAKYGVNRVSFGVQSFDRETLERNKRGFQREDFIRRAVDLARDAGIRHINLDLIIGFNNDTRESVVDGFEKIIEMGATSVCIYPLRASDPYLRAFWDGDEKKFRESKKSLINETVDALVETGSRYGYEFPSLGETFNDLGDGAGFTFKKRDVPDFGDGDRFCTDDFIGTSSILGVGQFALSKIGGNRVVYTNERGVSPKPGDDQFLVHMLSGEEMVADDFARRFVYFNSIDINDIILRTGVNPLASFSEEIKALEDNGRIVIDNGKIVFTDDDLKGRTNDLLFFVSEDAIKESMAENHKENKNNIKEKMENLPDKKDYPNQEEMKAKIDALCNKTSAKVVDGYLISFGDDNLKIKTVDGEEKDLPLDDEMMTVNQTVIRSADGEETLWREIDKESLTDNMKLSLVVSKEGDKVLLVKEVAIFE